MKHLTLIAICSCMAAVAIAQSPVITAQNVYLVGDASTIAWCSNDAEPGAAGENVIWDFSDLVEDEELIFNYVDPSETLWGYQFPNASLCGISNEGFHSYYSVANNFLTIEGYAGFTDEGQTDTLKLTYTDVEELIPLPFQYGDAHIDTFEGQSQVSGFNVNFTGDIDFEADGYGTLILPNGTYTDAIRYHFNRTQTNTILGVGTTTTKEQWGWMSPDHRFWLCLMETNDNGFGEEHIVWYAKNPLALNTIELQTKSIEVYPNPVEIGQVVHFNVDFQAQARVRLHSMDGKLAGHHEQYLHQGINALRLGVIPSPGVYILHIETDQNVMTSKLSIK